MKYVFCLIVTVLIIGCSSSKEPTGVIPEQQLKALEKAKEVDDMLKARTDELNKKLQENK